MGKFTTYMFIISGLLLFSYFFGLTEGGATNGFLSLLLNPDNVGAGSLKAIILTVIGSLVAVGVTAVVTKSFNPDIILMSALAPVILEYGYELMIVLNILRDFSPFLAIMIFSPLIITWGLTVVEWWRGITT